ncbi:MAG TPA: hypothetical protein VM513_13710 [Kofleriaceae bacterium]|nr:hypothetical protein [Kofleriaceae bacterium]
MAVLAAGCVRQLPPAPTPPPVAPRVEAAAPPPQGYGRLIVDVVEGPAPVQRIHMASQPVDNGRGRTVYRFSEQPEPLCTAAPCAADVPIGNILLAFPVVGRNAQEVELVHVGPDPSVYRRALSIYEDKTGGTRVAGIIATSLGGTAMMTGAALLPIGLAKDNSGLTLAGSVSLGAGVVSLVLGILAMRADAPTFRPGASNHFPLQGATP